MRSLLLALISLSVSASAFASPQGSCKLVNGLGTAELVLEADGTGEIKGLNGESPVRRVTERKNYGAYVSFEIDYTSRIASNVGRYREVKVILALVASPGTALMGVNYQGLIALPLSMPGLAFPGPFSYSGGGWLNPFGPFVPTMIPAGYAPIAAAYCNLRL